MFGLKTVLAAVRCIAKDAGRGSNEGGDKEYDSSCSIFSDLMRQLDIVLCGSLLVADGAERWTNGA